jgi:hypothetical protein
VCVWGGGVDVKLNKPRDVLRQAGKNNSLWSGFNYDMSFYVCLNARG